MKNRKLKQLKVKTDVKAGGGYRPPTSISVPPGERSPTNTAINLVCECSGL